MLLLGGAWAAALRIAAVSWCILATGGFARWLGWFGLVCSLLLLFSVLFFPILLLPIWAIVVSTQLWRQPTVPAM